MEQRDSPSALTDNYDATIVIVTKNRRQDFAKPSNRRCSRTAIWKFCN